MPGSRKRSARKSKRHRIPEHGCPGCLYSYAQALHVTGTPTFMFHDLDGKEIMRVVGPIEDAAEFLLLGEFIASGACRSSKFAEYKKSKRRKRGS